jgi:hypothetical protein
VRSLRVIPLIDLSGTGGDEPPVSLARKQLERLKMSQATYREQSGNLARLASPTGLSFSQGSLCSHYGGAASYTERSFEVIPTTV